MVLLYRKVISTATPLPCKILACSAGPQLGHQVKVFTCISWANGVQYWACHGLADGDHGGEGLMSLKLSALMLCTIYQLAHRQNAQVQGLGLPLQGGLGLDTMRKP